MNEFFTIWFTICLAAHIAYTLVHIAKNSDRYKKLTKLLKRHKNIPSISLLIGYMAYFAMIYSDPKKLTSGLYPIDMLGLLFIGIGFVILVLAAEKHKHVRPGTIPYFGIYAKLRHPYYYAFALILMGLPIYAGSLYTLATCVIWVPLIMYWRTISELHQLRKYKSYIKYKDKSWF